MGVSAILPETIVGLTPNLRAGRRRAPVLTARLRVLTVHVGTPPILTDCCFDGRTSIGVDRICRARHNRSRQATVGRERELRAVFRHRLAGIATHKRPFTALTLELHNV